MDKRTHALGKTFAFCNKIQSVARFYLMRKWILSITLDEPVQNLPLNNSNFAVRELDKFSASLDENISDNSIERDYDSVISNNEVALISNADTAKSIEKIDYLIGEKLTTVQMNFSLGKNAPQKELGLDINNSTRLESPNDIENLVLPDNTTPDILSYELCICDTAEKSIACITH